MKNDNMQKCDACGSNRVVAGKVSYGDGLFFEFSESELKEERYWTSIHNTPRTVDIRDHGSARLCLDCGAVSAALIVDVKDAKKVLDKWGTDALKSRLAAGNESV